MKERCVLPSSSMLADGERYRRCRTRAKGPKTLVSIEDAAIMCEGLRRSHIKRPEDGTREFLSVARMMVETVTRMRGDPFNSSKSCTICYPIQVIPPTPDRYTGIPKRMTPANSSLQPESQPKQKTYQRS